MKKRIAIIMASVLIIATLCACFTACNGTEDLSVLNLKSLSNEIWQTAGKEITELRDFDYVEYYPTEKNILLSKKIEDENGVSYEYALYDSQEGEVFYVGKEMPQRFMLGVSGQYVQGVFYKTYQDESGAQKMDLFNDNGVLLENVDCDEVLDEDGYLKTECIVYGGLRIGKDKILRPTVDGLAVYDYDPSSLDTVEGIFYTEELRDCLYSYRDGSVIFIEEKTLKEKKSVRISEIVGKKLPYDAEIEIFALPDNNVLVQAVTYLPDDAENYDFIVDSDKYGLALYVYDSDSGKTKEIKKNKFVVNDANYIKESNVSLLRVKDITDEKMLSDEYLQSFDGNLDVVVDIQALLPDADEIMYAGGYVILSNGSKMAFFDESENKINEVSQDKIGNFGTTDYYSFFEYCDCLAITGGAVIGFDGSTIFSFESLGVEEIAGITKNYIFYIKSDYDDVTGLQAESLVCVYDRKTGESTVIAEESRVNFTPLTYSVEDSETGRKDLYSFYDNALVAEGLYDPRYDYNLEEGILHVYDTNPETGEKTNRYFVFIQ